MATSNKGKTVEMLVVEDNPGDVRLIREALREVKVEINLSVVGDGDEALRFLNRESDYLDAPRPDLIFLDLNLPRISGREVLSVIKKSARFRKIPVVVLTSSSADLDIDASYDLGANSYLTKPVQFENFMDCMQAVEGFWLTLVRFPSDKPASL